MLFDDNEETLDELVSAEPEPKKHKVEVNKGVTNDVILYKYLVFPRVQFISRNNNENLKITSTKIVNIC